MSIVLAQSDLPCASEEDLTKEGAKTSFVPHQGQPLVPLGNILDDDNAALAMVDSSGRTVDLLARTSERFPSDSTSVPSELQLSRSGSLGTVYEEEHLGEICTLCPSFASSSGSFRPQMLCSTTYGAVFCRALPDRTPEQPQPKRARRGLRSPGTAEDDSWEIVSPQSHHPPVGCVGGWCGVQWLNPSQYVRVTEFDRSVGVVDVSTRQKVTERFTSALPTSVVVLSPHTFAVSEGSTISVWDGRKGGASSVVARAATTSRAVLSQLVVNEKILPHTVVSGDEERSVILWDVRKWTTPKTERNTLKYGIRSIALLNQDYVCVAAVDSEARCVHIGPEKSKGGKLAADEEAALADGSSFRNRIKTAVHCSGTWRGGWFGFHSQIEGTPFAVGCSVANEVYFALPFRPRDN